MRALLIALCLGLIAASPVLAAGVNIRMKDLVYTKAGGEKLAKKIGGMKTRTSSVYRSCYAKGKKIGLGINENAQYPGRYIYLKNSGNKKVRFCGMKIGMKYAKAVKKLTRCDWRVNTKYKERLYIGNASELILSLKKGKAAGWEYILAPTG